MIGTVKSEKKQDSSLYCIWVVQWEEEIHVKSVTINKVLSIVMTVQKKEILYTPRFKSLLYLGCTVG